MREVRALSRAGRENQIFQAMLARYERDRVNGGTAYWVAEQIGMRPTSPSYRAVLKGMVEEGKLIKTSTKSKRMSKLKNGGGGRHWYALPDDMLNAKKKGNKSDKKIKSETQKGNSLQLVLF